MNSCIAIQWVDNNNNYTIFVIWYNVYTYFLWQNMTKDILCHTLRRGVLPSLSPIFGFACHSNNSWTTGLLPFTQARCKGVLKFKKKEDVELGPSILLHLTLSSTCRSIHV